jgi:hypothetical protein
MHFMGKDEPRAIDTFLNDTSSSSNRFFAWIENKPHSAILTGSIVVGFIFRLAAALSATGVIHPDEIFQGFEMAHHLLYDSPVENDFPPEFKKEYPGTPSYAASRSWIFPLILGSFMKLGDILGLDYHDGTLPMIRIILAINATLLIPATSKLTHQITKNRSISSVTAIMVASYWRLVEYTVRPLTNTFFLPFLFYGIYRALVVLEKNKISWYDHFIAISCLGIPSYVRLDLGVTIFSFFIVTFSFRHLRQYEGLLFDGSVGWLIGIVIDHHYFGRWFTVPVNWFKFNIIQHHSDWFGLESSYFYIQELIYLDNLWIWILFLLIGLSIIALSKNTEFNKNLSSSFKSQEKGSFQLLGCTVITWVTYTSFWRGITISTVWGIVPTISQSNSGSHKEIRFIMAGLVTLIITISATLVLVIDWITEFFIYKTKDISSITVTDPHVFKAWTQFVSVTVLLLLILSVGISTSSTRWHYEQYDDVNQALAYVGKQDNVTGVIAASPWYQLGSYTYLHLGPDVQIRTFDFSVGNSDNFNQTRSIAEFLLRVWKEGNYMILPRYQAYIFSTLWDWLRDYGWQIDNVIDGATEVWKRN